MAATTVLALAALFGPAAADEAKTPISAVTILSIVSAPVDLRKNADDMGLKDPIASASAASAGEILSDGSVRYGRTIITVRNPCPPGEHLDPLVLPGRARR